MDFNSKGYLLKDNDIIPLLINENILSDYFFKKNISVNKNELSKYLNFEYHYQYLEFYCDYFNLKYDKRKSDNLVMYANYLNYILSSNGYIAITIIKPDGPVYNADNLPLFSKNKVQIKPQTMMIIPNDKKVISEGQKKNLNELRKILEYQTDLDIYSYKSEEDVFNGIYEQYDVDNFFNRIVNNKKSRFSFFR